jgi:hypothetical protein
MNMDILKPMKTVVSVKIIKIFEGSHVLKLTVNMMVK